METSEKIRIGILTQPVSDKVEPSELPRPDQYILDPLKSFLEHSGRAEVLAIRYDLCHEPDTLKRTLDSLDGVLYTGGFLQIQTYSKMPTASLWYYNTATEILKYCVATKLPLLGICQGF